MVTSLLCLPGAVADRCCDKLSALKTAHKLLRNAVLRHLIFFCLPGDGDVELRGFGADDLRPKGGMGENELEAIAFVHGKGGTVACDLDLHGLAVDELAACNNIFKQHPGLLALVDAYGIYLPLDLQGALAIG